MNPTKINNSIVRNDVRCCKQYSRKSAGIFEQSLGNQQEDMAETPFSNLEPFESSHDPMMK